jgi:hypothetical protein
MTRDEAIKIAYRDRLEAAEDEFEMNVRTQVDLIESLSNSLRAAKER